VLRDDRHPTTVAHVLVDRRTGARRFIVRDRRALEGAAPDFDLAGVRGAAVLLIDGHFPQQALRAARRAREVGVPVVADFADTRPAFMRLLPFVDHPVVPQGFVHAWGKGGPVASLGALAAICPGTPVVTLGARGAVAWIDGRAVRIPARRVHVRDTTGAGDVFHGAFAAGLARGMAPLAALHLATRAGAHACTALGGTGALLGQEALRPR
jgi:sulfofructose kinase